MSNYRRPIAASVIKAAFAQAGGRCAFPGCQPLVLENGEPLLEIAFIESLAPGSQRYSARLTPEERTGIENLVVLCPTHHAHVDINPETYSSDVLRQMREAHIERVEIALDGVQSRATTSRRLTYALEVWENNRENATEEYWQKFFSEHPEVLVLALDGRAYTLSSKCYVGGKSVDNTGGNELDFLAQYGGNVALIEIKTPMSKLLTATKYRANVFAPSKELAGSTVQVLEYRNSLLCNLPNLAFHTPGLRAAHPLGVVLIGNMEREITSEDQRRSFELYRSSLRDLKIMTYDELFDGIRMLANAWTD
ncbi:Shedu immune nuclease family protein [Streptomyces sp. NPDC004533]|uniref:Shedu immune nuclease family protein n=1 Tax=Streptomyces sp. NPDC004533 TaxID=3154278 RepID=UPI0033B28170